MNVRKRATSLSTGERDSFIAAVLGLKGRFIDGSPTSVYDQFVAAHLAVVTLGFVVPVSDSDPTPVPGSASGPAAGVNGGHGGSAFLPWHREFLRRYELALQSVDPTVTLPYWDWTDHEGTQNVLFHESFLGGRGAAGGGPVTTGPFKGGDWDILEALHSDWNQDPPVSLGTTLVRDNRRDVDELAEPDTIRNLLGINTYPEFRETLESGQRLHGFGHVWIGGSMLQMTSPNDPIFFMHHAMVDRIWDIWQQKRRAEWQSDPANAIRTYSDEFHYVGAQYGHQLYQPMWPWDGGISTPATVVPATPANVRPFFLPDTVTLPSTASEVVRPVDLLDSGALGICYDNPTQFD